MDLTVLDNEIVVLSGSANPTLAQDIVSRLDLSLGTVTSERFPDGETSIRLATSVRGRMVFLIQPTCAPVNEHLMELLMLADTCRRAAAGRIIAVIPYFGYARADKRQGRREPIAASMVAQLMQAVGIQHVITLDLHAPQIEGFFHIPVDSLTAVPFLCDAVRDHLPADTVVVSPDAGRVHMASEYAQNLNTTVAVVHKRRESGVATEVTHVVGDVRDHACLIIDDMISTGGTIARASDALLRAGARTEMVVAATHGLFVAGARQQLAAKHLHAIYVTNSLPGPASVWPRLHTVSIAWLMAEAIRRLATHEPLQELG